MSVSDDRGTEPDRVVSGLARSPHDPDIQLDDAATAIKQEYRISVRKKRLRCLEWEHVTEREDGSIYSLKVGRSVEFDWTWEGAIAYPAGCLGGRFVRSAFPPRMLDDESLYWCGEVVEVDETGGRIFVSISNPDQKPTHRHILCSSVRVPRHCSMRSTTPSRLPISARSCSLGWVRRREVSTLASTARSAGA